MDRWAEGAAWLCAQDRDMAAFVASAGPCTLAQRRHGGYFAALARAIVYQQLAIGAAQAIHRRFAALYGDRPSPPAVLATPDEDLRAAGLSGAKVAAIKDLAARVVDGRLRLAGIGRLPDEDVVTRLCTVRGIGPWTAQMFLMFQLTRPDVWPVLDLSMRAGWARIHRLEAAPSAGQLAQLGERYRPWRTVAAWYCWRAMEAGVSSAPAGW